MDDNGARSGGYIYNNAKTPVLKNNFFKFVNDVKIILFYLFIDDNIEKYFFIN